MSYTIPLINNVPILADVHAVLCSALVTTHLLPYDGVSLFHHVLREIPRVGCCYLGADRWAGIPILLGDCTHGKQGQENLAHVLALVQVSSLEDVSVLQSECLAALDELFDILHLFESHLLCVDLLDKGLTVQRVEQLAEDLSVLEAVLEVVHSHFLVRERLSKNFLDPCSALYFLVKVVLGFKLLLDISTQTGFLGSDGRHCVGMLKLFVI